MQTREHVLIPAVYLVFATLEAIATTTLVAALAFAADLSGLTSESVSGPASKILAAVIGLAVSWLLLVKWQAKPSKKLLTAALVLVGTYIISVVVAILVVHKVVGA